MEGILLISVIVPIYNVASYLRECLDSLTSQSYQNLEIILINDGSTDGSQEIAEEYLKDPRVSLISQTNGGLSRARNVGMQRAKGDFIAFVDSDDYLACGFLEQMLNVALEHRVDFVCNENIAYFTESPPLNPQSYDPQSIRVCVPDASNIIFGGAVWRFLFSKDFLLRCGVQFLENKIHEDEAFLYMVAPLASSFVRFVGEPYFYRRRDDSIMARQSKIRSYDLLDVFEEIYLFYQKRGLLEKFDPPYVFLYRAGVGYENQNEYFKKSEQLAKKLGLKISPPPPRILLWYAKDFAKRYGGFSKLLNLSARIKRIFTAFIK